MAGSDFLACRRCGAPLESQYCTTCGLDSRCTSCGASIISPFCINCGTVAPTSAAAGTMLAVSVDPQAQVPVSSRLEEGDVSASGRNIWHRNTRSLLIIAGLIAATIVLAGSAVALIGGGGDSHNSASSETADVVESPSTSIAAAVKRPGSSSSSIARCADSREMSASVNDVKNERVSAMDAIEAPTPPAPITRMFMTTRLKERPECGVVPMFYPIRQSEGARVSDEGSSPFITDRT